MLCISCCTHSCGQNRRRAALTTRPSLLPAGRHLVQAGGGAAALRRGAVLQVRAPAPHMLPMSTPRLAWPPTVKLSGAATHAVNLPSQAAANGGWRALASPILQRTRVGVCLRGKAGSRGRWKRGGHSPLSPRRDVLGRVISQNPPSFYLLFGAPQRFSASVSFRVRRR